MSHKLTQVQIQIYKKLKKPWDIQDYLNTLEINFEENGETHLSPKRVIEENKAQCIEGACLAASILRYFGHPPLLLDLRTAGRDVDHVVALFQWKGYFGAIGKTNHAVLRYRDPIYKTVRELVLSYFHEYFLDTGEKTLREYSKPFDLSRFDTQNWETTDSMLWSIPQKLDESPHVFLVNTEQANILRPADRLEIEVGKFTEWELKKNKVLKTKLG